MPNIIDASGLTTKTKDEIVTYLNGQFQTAYGADINLEPSSPDGQIIGIIAQLAVDNLDLQTQIYNTFNPDNAIGTTLDARAALNGIQRKGGTFTLTNITVVTDRSLSLAGLDTEIDNPDGVGYTVQDSSGNKFILAASQVVAGAGTYVYQFRAKDIGAVLTVPNTITTPVTIVLGVVSVNNPTALTSLGIDQEQDSLMKVRRQRSLALSSRGYLEGLLAALLNVNSVTAAFVYENVTGAVDGDGVPEHSIWVIVNGGSDADVAAAIYSKRNAGCGMKGSEVVNVLQVDGTLFTIKFDRVTAQNLYIQLTMTPLDGVGTIDTTFMKAQIVARLVPGVYEQVNINELSTIVQQIDPNALVVPTVGDGFSLTAGSYTNTLTPSAKNRQFALATARIAITVI